MIFGYVALAIAVRYADRKGTLVAALFLTLAIVSHHFTAMGAVEIVPDPTRASDALSLSAGFLAVAIAGVALTVLGMSLVGVLADRRLASRTRKFEEIISQLSLAQQQVEGSQRELREQKLRLDSAINHMGEGLCMFDAEKRLVVCNDRYARMYRLPPELLRPGTPHGDIIRHRITSGILKGETSDNAAKQVLVDAGRAADQRNLKPDRRTRRRPVDLRDAATDARRRLGCNASRRHRAAADRGQDHPYGPA